MTKLEKQNYNAIIKRGLITPTTTKFDFIAKINEEFGEFENEITSHYRSMGDDEAGELADLINACKNTLIFCGRDPEEELRKVLNKNLNRED